MKPQRTADMKRPIVGECWVRCAATAFSHRAPMSSLTRFREHVTDSVRVWNSLCQTLCALTVAIARTCNAQPCYRLGRLSIVACLAVACFCAGSLCRRRIRKAACTKLCNPLFATSWPRWKKETPIIDLMTPLWGHSWRWRSGCDENRVFPMVSPSNHCRWGLV